MTGPRSSFVPMSLNYGFAVFSSVLFAVSTARYLYLTFRTPLILVELALSILCTVFSISCSLTEPGIVSLKTGLSQDPEMPTPPHKTITSGVEYYS